MGNCLLFLGLCYLLDWVLGLLFACIFLSAFLCISYSCYVPASSLQSWLTLCNSMLWCPPGSSVHGILQARILELVAVPSSRGSSQPRDWTQVSCLLHWQAGLFFFFFKQTGSGQNFFCSDILLATFHFLPQRHPLRIDPECSFWCIFSGFPGSSVG